MISASGSSTLHIHDTTDPSIPLKQSIPDAHKLGCHHVCTSRSGNVAASAGFGGELKIWQLNKDTGEWSLDGEATGPSAKPGEIWALALSEDGAYLATTTNDGRVNVWDIAGEEKTKIREFDTGSGGSGSFGMSVDLSRDGKYTASGHQDGSVYIFNNNTGRILYSLSGKSFALRFWWYINMDGRTCETRAIGCLLARQHSSCRCWRCRYHRALRPGAWRTRCKLDGPHFLDHDP